MYTTREILEKIQPVIQPFVENNRGIRVDILGVSFNIFNTGATYNPQLFGGRDPSYKDFLSKIENPVLSEPMQSPLEIRFRTNDGPGMAIILIDNIGKVTLNDIGSYPSQKDSMRLIRNLHKNIGSVNGMSLNLAGCEQDSNPCCLMM